MKLLDKLEMKWGRFAIPNLALYILGGQVVMYYLLYIAQYFRPEELYFVPELVLRGQVERLVSFPFIPFYRGLFGFFFGCLIFFSISQALEHAWGAFKFNLFIFSGILISIVAGFALTPLFPNIVFQNTFIYLTVFFAFATLYPNHEFLMFFVIPVKVKYLAMFLAFFAVVIPLFQLDWGGRFSILASVSNYILFFGPEVVRSIHYRKRRSDFHAKQETIKAEAFHTCSVCGATDKSHPDREFRYREGKGICSVCIENERNQVE